MNHPGRPELVPITFPALGTTASVVVTDRAHEHTAVDVLRDELDAMDRAASRFRSDSELCALNAAAGRGRVEVSELLFRAVSAAVRAARLTSGLVDPTVGEALILAGYDRDFQKMAPTGPTVQLFARPVPGWRAIHLDPTARTIRLPAGVILDLGATAKALCADLAAARIHATTGAGALISLGGDVALAGPAPERGWTIRITHDHAEPPEHAVGPIVSVRSGGLATSSTSVRRWIRGGAVMHHLIDPATGLPAAEHWRTVSVAGGSCLDANIASCAAILLGQAAPGWLSARDLPARLVDPRGIPTYVGGWPPDTEVHLSTELASC